MYRRLSHTATQVGSYLFIWGGHDGTSYTSELLMLNIGAPQYLYTSYTNYEFLCSIADV